MSSEDAGLFHVDSAVMRVEPVHFEELAPAASRIEHELHRAALEWSLDAPITIGGAEDVLSRREWIDRFEPYAHQIQNLITFCRRAPVTLLADDVGLGKTISAGLILCELMVRRKVSRSLVIAPKLLLEQWQEELAVKFNIPSTTATGAELNEAIRKRLPVVITTYHSARNSMSAIRKADFDMLILDEAHKLRNLHGTSNPPRFAEDLRKCLADRIFKYVLMLTATPIQNRMWDLYSLIDLMTVAKGHSNPLGSPELFKSQYLLRGSNGVHLRPTAAAKFRLHLSKYIVRTRRKDVRLLFPERDVRLVSVKPSPAESRLLELASDLFSDNSVSLNGLSKSSLGQALMSSPEAFLAQLRGMAQGDTVPEAYATRAERILDQAGAGSKLQQVFKLIQELRSASPSTWRLVIFTGRRVTQEAIGAALREEGIPFGYIRGGQGEQNVRTVREFRDEPGKCHVVVSTDAGAEGVNLQSGNVLVNFDLPWNPMIVEQRIGRIQRLASSHAKVQILNLALKGSVEEHVVARLMGKLQAIAQSIGDIEAVLDSGGTETDAGTFEAMIRDLVVKSLQGLDLKESVRLQEQSILEAKRIFDEEAKTVEQTLGDLRDLHREGPQLPNIEPIVPSMEPRVFATQAIEAEGGSLSAVGADVLEVRFPRQHPFRITFKREEYMPGGEDGAFGGNRPRPMVPGKRDFERLAQRWCDRSAAFVRRRILPDEDTHPLLAEWFNSVHGWELVRADKSAEDPVFVGQVTCRASVANSFDRLETLIDVNVLDCPEGIELDAETDVGEPADSNFTREHLGPGALETVRERVATEANLRNFHSFYSERQREEMPQALKAGLRRMLEEQFACSVHSEVVAVSGLASAVYRVTALIRAAELGEATLDVLVQPDGPDGWRLSLRDELVECERTHRRLPEPLTSVCSVSGQRLANSMLETCAVSGLRADREVMLTCEVSGDRLIPREAARCDVSGRVLRKDLTEVSGVSGKRVDRVLLTPCELTGTLLLETETGKSEVSGRLYRVDESQRSTVSGRIGHRSEFVLSADPPGLIATEEGVRSDLSGVWMAKARAMKSDKVAGRVGMPSEMRTCELTGQRLLLDEMGISAVSGRAVDLELLVPSAVSGKLALRDEMRACEVTGDLVLPVELGRCEVSGRMVRMDKLESSSISGRKALAQVMVRCPERHALVLPEETEVCAVTGLPTSRDRIGVCAITGRRAGRSRMITLAGSETQYIQDVESERKTQEITGQSSLERPCPLLNKPVLAIEMKSCTLTGLLVHGTLLNESGEVRELRAMLNGERAVREQAVPEAVEFRLKRSQSILHRAGDFRLCGFGSDRFGAVAKVSRGLLRGSDIVGFLFESNNGAEVRFLCDVLIGQRRKGVWSRGAN